MKENAPGIRHTCADAESATVRTSTSASAASARRAQSTRHGLPLARGALWRPATRSPEFRSAFSAITLCCAHAPSKIGRHKRTGQQARGTTGPPTAQRRRHAERRARSRRASARPPHEAGTRPRPGTRNTLHTAHCSRVHARQEASNELGRAFRAPASAINCPGAISHHWCTVGPGRQNRPQRAPK
eukprot:scaffold13228_cov112-Isochrysis_galbana.AAC.1